MKKERPIIFNGEMVTAILDGRKTQTRRPLAEWQYPSLTEEPGVEPRYPEHKYISMVQKGRWGFGAFGATEEECLKELVKYSSRPFGNKGDHLWVRETFYDEECICQGAPIELRGSCKYCSGAGSRFFYRADTIEKLGIDPAWRPSIHMPRAASRITLEIVNVRVERLQALSEEDAISEGSPESDPLAWWLPNELGGRDHIEEHTHRAGFRHIWDVIYGGNLVHGGSPLAWKQNPWVWVIDFKRI